MDILVQVQLPFDLPNVRVKLTINAINAPTIVIFMQPQDQADERAGWKKRSSDGIAKSLISRKALRSSKEDLPPPPLGPTAVRLLAGAPVDPAGAELVRRIKEGLDAGYAPEPITEGEGGTYKLFGKGKQAIAIFKPTDEEPGCDGNPKNLASGPTAPRNGICPGQGAARELAAYLLDRGFAGVPCTALVELRHPLWAALTKTGSVQAWCADTDSCADLGCSQFPVGDVHRIGALDVRLLSTDRHEGNILAARDSEDERLLRLIPIDHGLCLPSSLGEASFAWLHWPQAKVPFDAATLQQIAAIDLVRDCEALRHLGLGDAAIKNMRLATLFLQAAAAAGWTLHDIGKVCSRPSQDAVSELELLAAEAKRRSLEGGQFWEHYWAVVTARVAKAGGAPPPQ